MIVMPNKIDRIEAAGKEPAAVLAHEIMHYLLEEFYRDDSVINYVSTYPVRLMLENDCDRMGLALLLLAEAISSEQGEPDTDPLDVALADFKTTIAKLPKKKRDILTDWIVRWNRYLSLEDTFRPEFVPRYKRGDIVYVDFGFMSATNTVAYTMLLFLRI